VPTARLGLALALPALAAAALAGCAPAEDEAATTTSSSSPSATEPTCDPSTLPTTTAGRLTVATDEPAYEPWMVDNDPSNGKGFESAVAYAVADRLGFAEDEVDWVRVPFTNAISPGPKDFDFDINQSSITDERKQAVDFSSPYYDVTQTVVAIEGGAADGVTDLDGLRDLKLGAAVGTTSLEVIEDVIKASQDAAVFNTNDDAKVALQNGQIDALVLDFPTAYYVASVELDDGVIVGQLPTGPGAPEQFGLVLDKGSPLTSCVSLAVDDLRADGTLGQLEQTWLAQGADAPVLQ
jgi:polar amino acid transport system substrate-binding protein